MAYVKGTKPAGETLDYADGITDSADMILGNAGTDFIYAGGGDDFIKGGGGADFLDGGAGRDAASYADSAVAVDVNLATFSGKGGTAEGDVLVNIEDIVGSDFSDKLTGDAANNLLEGGKGDDILKGGGGVDTLNGGLGNDILETDGILDHVNGGLGIDTLVFESDRGMYVNLEYGVIDPISDTFGAHNPHPARCFVTDVENVIGTKYDDRIVGSDFANTLNGGEGHDRLSGGKGNDILNGETGNDTIDGGLGVDRLTGGQGHDTFVYREMADSVMTWFGPQDLITDFQQGIDKIDLTELSFAPADMLMQNNLNVDGVNYSFAGIDANHNGIFDPGEFAIAVKMAAGATLNAGDFLI